MASVRQRRMPAAPAASVNSYGVGSWEIDHEIKPDVHELLRRRSGLVHRTVPNTALLGRGFLFFYVLIIGVVHYYHHWLPTPLPLDAPSSEFSEARSRVVLEKIQSFGYRPVGTRANEVLIPKYLLSQIQSIKEHAIAKIEVDVQQPTGAFFLDFLTQFQNIYANVSNIVVRVSDQRNGADPKLLENALMLSSHYDAAIGGAAASDDGVNIAIMVELLRYYSLNPPKHAALIFNFNGAEETIMQAAHGFITQHPWASSIKAFINLEAAGAGGRELLFQTGSDELALVYAEGAKYPFASIIAQELFQSGIIPADTDFRVYRDFGAVAGMDFAYISNGYVYHTMLDDITRIEPGAIQRFGENLVGIIQRLTSIPDRLNKVATTKTSTTVFFDVMGITMVSISKSIVYVMCTIVLVLAFVYLYQSPLSIAERINAISVLGRCFGMGLVAALATSIVLTLFAPLAWYSAPYLAGIIYMLPTLSGMLTPLIPFLEKHKDKSPEALWAIEEALFEGMLINWLILLVIVMYTGANSAYAMAMWVFFPLLGQMLCHSLQHVPLLTMLRYIVISLGAVLIPMIHTGFILAMGYTFIIPLMGRSGPQLPPDVLVAILFNLSLSVMLPFSTRFFCFIPVKQLVRLRNFLLILSFTIVIVASIRNPYSADCPKRIIMQHVSRETVSANGTSKRHDSGLWMNALDFRGLSTIKPYLSSTPWHNTRLVAPPPSLLETLDIYGEMPFSLPTRHILPERYSWYLPSDPPVFTKQEYKAILQVVSSKFNPDTNRRMIHLHLTGPSHLNIFIDATKTRLTSWSLGNSVDIPVPGAHGDVYILLFAEGYPPASFHFWIESESNNTIAMVVAGHHLEKVTSEMVEMRKVLPSWVDTMQAVSTWTSQTV